MTGQGAGAAGGHATQGQASADVYERHGLWLVRTLDLTSDGMWVEGGSAVVADPSTGAPDAGALGVECLSRIGASVAVPAHNFRAEPRESALPRLAGVRSWRAFAKDARAVDLSAVGDTLSVQPMTRKGDHFMEDGQPQVLSRRPGPAELGAAVIRAMGI